MYVYSLQIKVTYWRKCIVEESFCFRPHCTYWLEASLFNEPFFCNETCSCQHNITLFWHTWQFLSACLVHLYQCEFRVNIKNVFYPHFSDTLRYRCLAINGHNVGYVHKCYNQWPIGDPGHKKLYVCYELYFRFDLSEANNTMFNYIGKKWAQILLIILSNTHCNCLHTMHCR